MRIVQLSHPSQGRKTAVVQGETLRLLQTCESTYSCVLTALIRGASLEETIESLLGEDTLEYSPIYAGASDWKLMPSLDHPEEPARYFVGGTGLTHSKGAKKRDAMHAQPAKVTLTDCMKIYEWGVEGGKPKAGEIGVQPEWFHKGNGLILRAHNEPLEIPNFADDGGEEPEVVGLYVIDMEGTPRRLGFAIGNEFSDHQMKRKNYLYLAPSKIRNCSVGPELVLNADFSKIEGTVRIERNGAILWEHPVSTGEANMTHTLANLEYHHFKYPLHRRPGDVHIHFFGTSAFSFGAGISLEEGDRMSVALEGFGKPLINPLKIEKTTEKWFGAKGI